MSSKVMTVEQAAKMLGLSRSGAYDAVARKEIPSLRFGRKIVVPKAAIEKMLQGERGAA